MTSPVPSVVPQKPRSWARFAILASIEFLTVMDASVVNIALPTMMKDLDISTTAISWVVNAYLIAFGGFLLLAGRLADSLGPRRLFVAGTALFVLGSAACGLANTSMLLIAARAVQGLGAALVMPSALALIAEVVPDGPDRHRALGIFSGMAGVAAPIGLVLGGVLAEINWHLIFWINVPLGTAVAVAAVRLLPNRRPQRQSADVVGAVAGTGSLILFAVAAAESGIRGMSDPVTLGGFAGAVALAAMFAVRQRTARFPLIPRVLLRQRSLNFGAVVFILVGTILLSTFFFTTLYLQQIRNLGSLAATAAYVPVPFAMLAGTRVAPKALRRLAPRDVLAAGLITQAAALSCWALFSSASASLITTFDVPAIIWAFGLGLSIVSSFVVCTSGIQGPMMGAASGIATTAYQGGGAVGLAIVALAAHAVTHHAETAGHSTISALLAGHQTALAVLTGMAAVAAVLTRAIPRPVQLPKCE